MPKDPVQAAKEALAAANAKFPSGMAQQAGALPTAAAPYNIGSGHSIGQAFAMQQGADHQGGILGAAAVDPNAVKASYDFRMQQNKVAMP